MSELADLAAERATSGIHEVLDALDAELIGLAPVKTRIREIAACSLSTGRGRTSARPPGRRACTCRSPATRAPGKTTVALRMAELLHRLGYLPTAKVVSVTRDDLAGQYAGHTAPKTKEALKRATGGVLFTDEAYYLYRAENERDYGAESIEILLQYMENHRAGLVVILAGYTDRMDAFFASNPGMSSRIAHHLEFPGYTLEELTGIAYLMLAAQRCHLSGEAVPVFRDYLTRRMTQPGFASARPVSNALERARLRQAGRPAAEGTPAKDDLMRLEPAGFLASRVFTPDRPAIS